MRLNLGCGRDVRAGYTNVDLRPPCDLQCDLSKLPWPWPDGSVDEILMLDFLEHFPYRQTENILQEVWRVLKPGGAVEIQVPDFEHCARAAEFRSPFLCNRCGWQYPEHDFRADFFICEKCRQPWIECAIAATRRLFGGQDYEGNWHFNTFTQLMLREILYRNGFENMEELEHDHQYANWNFKVRVTKKSNAWGDDG